MASLWLADSLTVIKRSFGVMTELIRFIKTGFKAQIAAGDDADQFFPIDDRHPGDIFSAGQFHHFAHGHIWRYGNGVFDDAAFVFFYPQHFAGLLIDGHIFVDDADAAFLGDGDCQPGFGDGIHCRRNQRDIQGDRSGELSFQFNITRQHGRMGGN